MLTRGIRLAALATAAGLGIAGASADILFEDFETVTGVGGGTLLTGAGFAETFDWDTGLVGENAFAGTVGNTQVGAVTVNGSTTAGVGGSGAGMMDVSGVTFNILDEDFGAVTGTGGGVFLAADPNEPNDPNGGRFGFSLGWDDGISNEFAFGGTGGGAKLLGTMSAAGVPGGGNGGTGGATLDVNNVALNAGTWFAGLQFDIGPFPGASALLNQGFEANGGSLDSWQPFGNASAQTTNLAFPTIIPRSGNALCKMFGNFTGSANVTGIFQSLPAQPGQTWQLDCWSRHNSDDGIDGTSNFMSMKIEYYDASGTLLLESETTILDANSPLDTWIDNAPLSLTAPAGTTEVRPVILFSQQPPGVFDGGAGHIDDVSFKITSGPDPVDLANFAMFADVKGMADAAGETLGDVQLRLEDPDGNRLRFGGTATGAYQTLGGTLSTAVEADANDVATAGAFNRNAGEYRLVVAFDNDGANPWGTGGTLDVDNLLVTNSDPNGSGWFAGMYWDNLKITEGDFNSLVMTADVMGNVVGGEIELRLEGFSVFDAGLNEDFETITQTGGGMFLDPNGGPGFLNNFDDGLTGEGAFGGTFGSVSILGGGGFSAQGVFDPNTGTGAAEIRVEGLVIGPGGGWFAGLQWSKQGLASTDLSQVMLTADIKGVTAGGSLGDYELRIEDAQGDRRFFRGTANGSWQSVGGTLLSATEGGRLGGGGDGTFDLDSPSYTVVVSFVDPETTWGSGGVLLVDNLFLTPVHVTNQIGQVSFCATATGGFQTIGGPLSAGNSTYGDNTDDMEAATGTGGGVVWDPNTGGGNLVDIDDGISFFGPETGFAGTFGGQLGLVTAGGCTTCGVGGGGAARITWDSAGTAGGGWFLGISFPDVPIDLSGDPNKITVSADIRGTGASLGQYTLRVEDADLDVLEFTVAANGAFQRVGGTLDNAVPASIPGSNGSFDYNQATYNVVLVAVEPSADPNAPSWGTTGGELTIDNLLVSGVSFDAADCHTLVVAYKNELDTWGSNGTLTVDNLSFAAATPCPGDVNGDNTVNITDLGVLLSNFGLMGGATFSQGDLNGDGNVNITDLGILLAAFGTPCP